MVLHVFTCKWSNPVRNKRFCFQVWSSRRGVATDQWVPNNVCSLPHPQFSIFFSHLTFITLIPHLITSFLLPHRARQAPAVFNVLWSGPAQLEANTPVDTGKHHKHQTARGLPGSLGFPGRVRGFVSLASDTVVICESPSSAGIPAGGGGQSGDGIQKTENIVPLRWTHFTAGPQTCRPPRFLLIAPPSPETVESEDGGVNVSKENACETVRV